MASLTNIRKAVASVIDGVDGLRVHDTYQQQVNPPAAVIMPQRAQLVVFDTQDGSNSYYLVIMLMVAYTEDASSQAQMDAYLDTGVGASPASSVLMALRADPTCGGQVSYCVPTAALGYGLTEWAGQTYFGVNISVTVVAP